MKSLRNLNSFIKYLEKTSDEEWTIDVVRKGNKNCVMGHFVNWYYGKDFLDNIMPAWDLFESMWATTYMLYPVNDGTSPTWMNFTYDQPTPKERIIAYLTNLNEGKEKTTYKLMEEDRKKRIIK